MRFFTGILLTVSSAFAYQVTYPGGSQGWNNTGPNTVMWERVDTDPLNFTVVLENQNIGYSEILDTNVDGTVGSRVCSTPIGGWPEGFAFRVNFVQDAQHLSSLLAQSNEFNITGVSSSGSTTSPSIQTATSTTPTSSAPTVSSSDTSTTPTQTSAASVGAESRVGWLTAVAALTALITTLF